MVIDSNFILLPFQYKINYLEEITFLLEGTTKFIFYQQIFDELNSKKKRVKKSRKFKLQMEAGLRYLDEMKAKYLVELKEERKEDDETTDDFILRKLKELKESSSWVFLASNDKMLRQQAREAEVSLIFLRQEKRLLVEIV